MSTRPSVSNRAPSSCAGRLTTSRSSVLAQRRHVDLLARPEKRLVALERPEEVGAQAHHRAQARVRQRLRDAVQRSAVAAAPRRERKAPRLGRCRERSWAAWVDRVPSRRRSVASIKSDNVALPSATARSSRAAASPRSGSVAAELPSVEERLDQRFERIGAGLKRQKAPLPAVLKDLLAIHWARPCPLARPAA